jgi:hypothetical protein
MNRKSITIFSCVLTLLILTFSSIYAQEAGITLKLSKDFGYAWAGDIQGTFSMKVTGPDNLARVEFLIDSEWIGEDSLSPFRYQFSTGNYVLGPHTLSAVGYLEDGRRLNSNQVNVNFVTSDEGWTATGKLVIPILGVVFGVMLLSFLVPWLMSRGKPKDDVPLGVPRNYGVAGGAICSRCKRPFSRHLLAPNMIFGKLERCPHCGKFGIAPLATSTQLADAEAAELEMSTYGGQTPNISEEERLLRDIDDSRYEDS